ncbi:MAG: dTMP kinase [Lysobacterales bacterium]
MASQSRGRFITLEGGEGAGKSTNLRTIIEFLKEREVPHLSTREPGGTALAETLRKVLLNPKSDIAPMSELLMVFAARFDHVEKVIVPALKAGTWVICDRFVDASFAYQGGGRGLSVKKIETLERWLPRLAKPDLTLLLDVSPKRGLTRATRGRAADRFEREQAEFYNNVRDAYLTRARSASRYCVIDAGRSRKAVSTQVLKAIGALVDQRHGGAVVASSGSSLGAGKADKNRKTTS